MSFTAPPGCPSTSEVEAALADKLGRDAIARPDQLARKLDITIEPKEGGFHARLALVDREGETLSRDVSAPTCAQATNAIVLVAALAARAQRDDEPPPKPASTPESKPETPPPPPSPPAQARRPEPRPREADRIVPEMFVALGIASGVGPTLAPGAGLGGRARFTHAGPSVGLSVNVYDTFRTDADGVDARFRRVAVRGELCPYEPALSTSIRLSPCLGIELGAHTGTAYEDGDRVRRSRTESLLWSQSTLALRLRVEAEPIVIDLGPELGIVFTRNVFALTGTPDDVVYRVSRVAFGARASIGLSF